MYVCQITGKQSKLGEKLNKITVATRPRTYTRWVRNEETNKWEEVFVSRGTEIVQEVNACEEGLALWNSWDEQDRRAFAQGVYPHLFKEVA